MEQGIRMNTTEEIQELLAIRKQMDELQARYDAILARAHTRPVSSAPLPGTVPVESPPGPKPTVSVPVAVPVIKPVETISASQGTVLSPVPVLKAPVATATPVPGPLVPSIPVLKSPSFLPELKPCQDAVKAPAAPAVPVVDAAGPKRACPWGLTPSMPRWRNPVHPCRQINQNWWSGKSFSMPGGSTR